MKTLLGFVLGVIVTTGLPVLAQTFFDSYDSNGGGVSGYSDPNSITTWQDRQGNHGSMYTVPGTTILPTVPGRNPC
jgi:hypothetical protein